MSQHHNGTWYMFVQLSGRTWPMRIAHELFWDGWNYRDGKIRYKSTSVLPTLWTNTMLTMILRSRCQLPFRFHKPNEQPTNHQATRRERISSTLYENNEITLIQSISILGEFCWTHNAVGLETSRQTFLWHFHIWVQMKKIDINSCHIDSLFTFSFSFLFHPLFIISRKSHDLLNVRRL